jgi:hypothetical protein
MTHHVLNLGAGVQSTTLYLMAMSGEVPAVEVAIFADTQEEPAAVYRHLEWLQSLKGPPILIRTKGKLGSDLLLGRNSTGQSFASIPAYTRGEGTAIGRTRRQCSSEYKVNVIEHTIRREILGLQRYKHIPSGTKIYQYFGISLDEKSRAGRIWERFHVEESVWAEPHFPLIERQMTRANCLDWLADKVPHPVPRSACTFCPFHSDAEWKALKTAGGEDWDRIVQIDRAIRTPGTIVNRNLDQSLYLHRTCKPIDEIQFQPKVNTKELQLGFGLECDGMCGV